jgi:hypothetical protein
MDHPAAAPARLNPLLRTVAMAIVIDQPAAATDTGAAVIAIRRLLDGIRREARKWIWIESLAWLVIGSAAVFWGSLAFDWSVEPPGWVRGIVGAAALCGLGWIVTTKLVARLAVPLADESLAIAVERGHPGFRDSLSTTIALAAADQAGIDGRLLARTAAEAAALLGDVDVARIFRRRRLVSLALLAGLAAATVGLLVAVRPAIGMTWAQRMLRLSPAPWPRRVTLEVEGFRAGSRTVARGADVELVVHARGSDRPPAEVDVRMAGPGGWTTARMGTRGAVVGGVQTFVHVLKNVSRDVTLEIRGGDARMRDLQLRAVDPPAVDGLAIRCVLPAYLGGGSRELRAARTIPIPRGSRVEIECTATKPLRSARIVQRSSAGGASRSTTTASVGADEPAADIPLATLDSAPPGTRTISGTLDEVLVDTAVLVRLEDSDGLVNRDGVAFTLVAVPDEPPRVGLRLVGGPTALTPRGRIMVEGAISDDHGLAAAAILLRSAVAPAADAARASQPIDRVRGGETRVDIAADEPLAVPIDSLQLGTGGRLLVAAEARDGCTLAGGPNIGTSDPWTLDIVTPDELRALLEAREILLRRRLEGAIDDVTRARERLGSQQADGAELAISTVTRCGEAALRAAGETGEIAGAFRGIGLELANNLLLSPDLDARVVGGIARPLAGIAAADLPDLAKACRQAPGGPAPDPLAIGRQADAVIARMRQVLATMLEAESINEIIERLRGVLRTQEQIRAETIETQKRQAREALERP